MAEPLQAPEPFFGHTNVSQPQLQHTNSILSVTASEDYYSVSSSPSEHSNEEQPQIRRYTTPPSRYRTPMQSGERLPREIRDPSHERRTTPMRGVGRRRQADKPAAPVPNPLASNPPTSPILRKPVPSTVYEGDSPSTIRQVPFGNTQSSVAQEMAHEPGPPTPEDDTPYIHFALDQLTRDEEVRGSRAYPLSAVPLSGVPLSKYAIYPQPRRLAPAKPQDDVPPAVLDQREQARQKLEGEPVWVDHRAPLRDLPLPPVMVAMDPQEESSKAAAAPPTPPRHPQHSMSAEMRARRPTEPDLLVPFEPPADSMYQPLTHLPSILRPLGLGLFIALLLLYLAALIFTSIWSRIQTGLWAYVAFGDGRYFVFQYLPTLLGMILLLWLFEIEIALYRIAPFIALSSESPTSRSHGTRLPIYPSGFVLPTFAHFAAGQPAVGTFLFISWLSIFTIPLLATSFNVYQTSGGWTWLATQGVIWVVIALYILLLLSTCWVAFYLWRRHTGLKWDPQSLADLLVLLERSNLLDAYASFYDYVNPADFHYQVEIRGDRLGYFRSSQRPNDVFHTIGAPNQAARSFSLEGGRLVEKTNPHAANPNLDPESGRPYSHATLKSLLNAHRWSRVSTAESEYVEDYLPWFLYPTFTIFWATTALVLLIAFLVVSYLPATAIHSGFLPELPVPVNNGGFSSDNFLYSFIPSFLGLLCLLFWYSIDLSLRRLQPFAALSQPNGVLAEHSLLLSYVSDGVMLVPLRAAFNGHFRLAMVSFTTLIASTLPILAGGVFWAQFYVPQQRVRISGQMPAFYALTVFLCIYALSYFLLPLTNKQAHRYSVPGTMPNGSVNRARSLIDIIGLTHQSRLLSDVAFHDPDGKTQLVTRLLAAPGNERLSHMSERKEAGRPPLGGSKTSLADSIRGLGGARQAAVSHSAGVFETPRFGVGTYLGRDGREYLGIDRINRHEGGLRVREL